jgi:hypothetical protein
VTTVTPYAPAALRDFLIANTEFSGLVPPEFISTTDIPDKITGPFVTLAAVSNFGQDPMLRKPLVQLDVWVPKWEILGGDVSPDEVAWNIADLAGRLVHKARIQKFRDSDSSWRATWDEGPITDVDKERGPDLPLFRAICRFEMKFTVR